MVKKFKWGKILYGDGEDNFHYAYYGNQELGYLEYWKPWKKWVWNQNEDIIMSKDCLKEVVKKIAHLTRKAK